MTKRTNMELATNHPALQKAMSNGMARNKTGYMTLLETIAADKGIGVSELTPATVQVHHRKLMRNAAAGEICPGVSFVG